MNRTLRQSFIVHAFLASSFQFMVSNARAQCAGEWIQLSPGGPPSARYYHAMAYDSNRNVTVLFGGSTAGGDDQQTWEWDATSWTKRNPVTSPSTRDDHAMAFDRNRGVTVLFGGDDALGFNAETWEWDGANWANKNPGVAPTGRHGHAMAYDSARRVTVLFGGFGATGDSGETWEWDGTTWSKRTPANSPTPREDHAMAFDSARNVTVLFGGDTAGDQTWEWNGTDWLRRFPASSPSARSGFSLTYDSSRGVCVLFGGYDNGTGLNTADTWEWDGTNWTQRMPVTHPTARYRHAAAFDSGHGVTVLFGGYVAAVNNETWEWDGPGPFIVTQPADQTVDPGQPASFSLTANGPGPYTYQWRKDGTALTDGGSISGATTATLSINPTDSSSAGKYDCVVSNACGHVGSNAAALTVNSPSPANPSAPCGTCGGGAATMIPLTMLAMAVCRRGWRRHFQSGRRFDETRAD